MSLVVLSAIGLRQNQTTIVLAAPPAQPLATPIPVPTVTFDHLTADDGLSESTVLDIVQDDVGFMWFATQQGLDKFDGYTFTVYEHDPDDTSSISNSNMRALHLGSDGTLWIGTWGDGLDRFDRRTETFAHYRHDPQDPASLSDNYVRAIHEDAYGALWVGTENGLNRLDLANETFTHFYHDPGDPTSLAANSVLAIAGDAEGQLWIGTANGLDRLDPADQTFAHAAAYLDDPQNPQRPNDILVTALLTAADGTLWVGTDTGLHALDPATGVARHYTHHPAAPHSLSNDSVLALYEDGAGNVWVGTRDGLNRLDPDRDNFTIYRHDPEDPTSLSGDTIPTLYESRAGILWIGTWAADLNILDPTRRKFPPPLALPSFALAIQEDQEGRLWIGTFGAGLFAVDRETQAITNYRHDPADPTSLSHDLVFALQLDGRGALWAGTLDGLNRFDPVTGVFTRYYHDPDNPASLAASQVRVLYQDSQGMLWAGTQQGLTRIDPVTETFTRYGHDPNDASSLSSGAVLAVHEDEAGALWVGTETGLNRLDRARETFTHYVHDPDDPDSLSVNMVTVIEPDGRGGLWIGTWGGGLNHLDPTSGTFTRYQKKHGLADNVVLGILEDGHGRLWISTSNGLSRFDPQTETFRTYDTDDGLPASGFVQHTYYQNATGEMFLGTGEGVLIFRPQEIRDNPYLPPVVLSDFQLYNRTVPIGPDSPLQEPPNLVRAITLRHDHSVFSFEFAALNFTNSKKNRYAYKMEGFDKDWNQAGTRRFATYTNLDPGNYTFRVIASNNDGLWNEEGLSIHLTITPPWWQTWWAYALYALAGFGLVAGYVHYRTLGQARQLEVQRRELDRERRLRAHLEQVDRQRDVDRARIAREMHDGLAPTLAGLRLRARTWQMLLTRDPARLAAEFDELEQVLHTSIRDVRRMIFDLRPVALEELGFALAVESLATHLADQHHLTLHTQIPEALDTLAPELENALFRMIQELLHNAARHAGAANVWLTIEHGPTTATLTVRDDGAGFDPAELGALAVAGHLGLRHLRERVEMLNGSVAIESGKAGTVVRIRVPLNSVQ